MKWKYAALQNDEKKEYATAFLIWQKTKLRKKTEHAQDSWSDILDFKHPSNFNRSTKPNTTEGNLSYRDDDIVTRAIHSSLCTTCT